MTTLNLPSGEYLLVDVPPRSWGYDLYGGMKADQLLCLTTTAPGRFKQHKINIPPGSYTLIGKGSEISEETISEAIKEHGKEPGITVVLKRTI